MRLLARLRSVWRNALHRSVMEREMSDEWQFHLSRRAEDLVQRHGVSPDEARRRARLEFGSIEKYKEQSRESFGLARLDEVRGDLRYAFRTLAGSKAFTIAAVLTLALGIGANTAIFSLIDAVMLRTLPVDKPEQLTMVLAERPGRQPEDGFTNAMWESIRDQQDVFSSVFAWSTPKQFDFAQGQVAQRVRGLMLSGDYFSTLGIAPAAGRLISRADDLRGCAPIAVLSYAFWQAHFAGAPSALGEVVSLNRATFQIVGVSAPGFFGLEVGKQFDVAIPLCAAALFDKRNLDSRSRWWLSIIGRQKPGMTPEQVRAGLEALSPGVMRASVPDGTADQQQEFFRRKLVPSPAATGPSNLRRTFGQPLNMLMAFVALVLLIACANIAGLILARATARAKEIAIRTALGASRARIVRQLLTESVLLSALGAGLGLLLARWGTGILVASLTTDQNPVFVDLSLDGRVLGFTAGVSLLTGILAGLLPALRSTHASLMGAMKSQQAPIGGRVPFRGGRWIVAGQIALSLVLLVGAGLLLRTFVTLFTLDAGFDRNGVLVATAKAPWFAADTVKMPPEQRAATYDEIGRRLRALPGVTSVARAFTTPIGDDNWFEPVSPGREATSSKATGTFNFVSPEYFRTLRTPLLAGRDFDDRDTKTSAPVAIVNESAARKFFPGVIAIGRHFRTPSQAAPIEIVGIAKDAKYESLREVIPPTFFLPAVQVPQRVQAEEFLIRTSIPPSALIPSVRSAIRELNSEVPLDIHTLAEQVADNLVQERLLATLSGFFGGLALLLAMVGLYGVLSYFVTQRRVEFGIRMALGAERGSILRLVMRDVVVVLAVGVATGLAAALASVKMLERMLFGLEPRDAMTMAAAACLLSGMALLAGYLPARRATRADPMIALRSE
jgi:putative ABC transport system permease protein